MQGSRFQLANTDAAEWLRTLPSESIDLVVTDPPYESLEKHRAIGTTTRLKHSKASSNDWFAIFPNTRFAELFAEIHRVLKRDRHFYLYCDPETMFVAKPLAEAAGFRFWKPIIWDKCLGPDTLVWTARGTVRIADIVEGDQVALPNGGTTTVVATRTTKAPAVRMTLSDGTSLVASTEHRFMRAGGEIVEARELAVEERLATRTVCDAERAPLEVRTESMAMALTIVGIEPVGEQELVDISVAHEDELFLLANGVVTHNCRIGMGYHYRARYECILFFEKGKRKLNDLGVADIITHNRVSNGYPAEKPPEVSQVLITQSTQPGEIVIDPFMGSGSVGVAAIQHGRHFCGNDLCDEAIAITRGRLRELGADEAPIGTDPTPEVGQLGLRV